MFSPTEAHGGDIPPNLEIVGPVAIDELEQDKWKLLPVQCGGERSKNAWWVFGVPKADWEWEQTNPSAFVYFQTFDANAVIKTGKWSSF